jgi:hypothetical protein
MEDAIWERSHNTLTFNDVQRAHAGSAWARPGHFFRWRIERDTSSVNFAGVSFSGPNPK